MPRKKKEENEDLQNESESTDNDLPPALDLDGVLDSDPDKSDVEKVLLHMMKDENIGHNTELNGEEITAFQTLGMISESYDGLEALQKWLLKGLTYRVSRGRRGRNEVVKITSRNVQMGNENQNDGFMARFKKW